SPYYSYVGFQLPKGEGYNDALLSNQNNLIPIVTVDEDGNPVARKKVKVEVYELGWRWWFDRSDENDIAKYVYSNSTHCIHTGYVDTPNGKAIYNLNLGIRTWGRKYIRITDPVTDHSAGQVFYTDYTGYWQDVKKQASGAEMLTFRTNKRKYQVGERVEVDLPATKIGRALVSIESGSKILDTFWVPINADNHSFHFKATPEMAPNVYVHVTYIQPHNQRDNDLPMRLYGIQPITVEDPETHLQPVISMPSVLVPEQEVTIKVREQQGKKMTYTIAMVDEGLLGITGFKTPAPWRHFYAREALGIKTWDMYPYVAGAYTGAMSGLRAVGGDEELFTSNIAGEKANRFEPVVHHIGPVALAPGRENTHTIKMPNYVGAVKTMVIAGQAGAYGSCTQTTPVKKPLMVVATLPRVVGPQEAVKMPVTVFAMDDAIREATVTIAPNAFFDVVGPKKKKVYFSSTGDKLVTFDLVVRKKIGVGKVKVTAQSGTEKATYAIELDVRLPNPRMTQTIDAVLEPGQTWETTYEPVGLPGTNNGTLEIAGIPPINLASRLQYLMQYPHGCVEQTTSTVFPQLYLSSLLDLTPQQRQQIQSNVMAGLQRLKSFQTNTGGFSYWPGEHYSPSKWGTNYAGHFMLEAQAAGYTLPVGLLDGWIKYQTTQANQWTVSASKYAYYRHSHQRIQAYRLYTLALADKPALGAMNRFRTSGNLSVTAQWLLAAAYHLAGKPEVAQELVDGLATYVKPYRELSYSYGSDTRDRAIILSALCLLQKRAEAKDIADSLAKTLSSDAWLGTQTTAYSLLAMAQFVGGTHATRGVQCTYQLQQGAATPLSTTAPITQVPLPIKAADPGHVAVTNTSTSTLFVKVQLDGIPLETTGPEQQNDLQMSIQYLDMAGQRINPSKLEQGKDFVAEVRVHHPGTRSDYKDMALVHHFPAGWEIKNDRLDQEEAKAQDTPTYQDIRDDRVYSYFDLKQHETKTFRVVLNATYIGRYYLPAVYCEAMYDASIHAQRNGQWVEVGE
ncbi:MAG: alpha-2-macroglobulin family protein, partial [Bacteroidota bacterium]